MTDAGHARAPHYLSHGHTLREWLTTHDHKRIAILYALSITAFFFIGGAAATLMRLELATPAGDFVSANGYNKLFTMHGIIMVWFFLIPSIPATLGNFLVPLMIGAPDLAFPRLNLASWYLYVGGALCTLVALAAGGVDTGWTFYAPFSTLFSNTHVVVAVAGVFVVGFSSILTGINFIATVHVLRAPGLTWFRLPLFVWAIYATSIILVLATPVLAMTVTLLVIERLLGIGIFDPAATRCCSSTCSGSIRIRPSTSWSCPRWASSARSSPASRATRCSAIARWRTRSSPSRRSGSSCGDTTCSCPGSRCTPAWCSRC